MSALRARLQLLRKTRIIKSVYGEAIGLDAPFVFSHRCALLALLHPLIRKRPFFPRRASRLSQFRTASSSTPSLSRSWPHLVVFGCGGDGEPPPQDLNMGALLGTYPANMGSASPPCWLWVLPLLYLSVLFFLLLPTPLRYGYISLPSPPFFSSPCPSSLLSSPCRVVSVPGFSTLSLQQPICRCLALVFGSFPSPPSPSSH